MVRSNSLSGKKSINEAEDPKIVKKDWCGNPIRSENFFNITNNSNILSSLKKELFECFTKINDSFNRILKGENDFPDNQKNDTIPITRTPNGFCSSYLFCNDTREKNYFKRITNWTDNKMKTITINAFDDKYMIETRSFHRIGDLKKRIGLGLDILPNKFVIENEYCLSDD
jgi:hypothetical protein